MKKPADTSRRGSLGMVGPYARARVILAVILFVIALGVLAFRAFTG